MIVMQDEIVLFIALDIIFKIITLINLSFYFFLAKIKI